MKQESLDADRLKSEGRHCFHRRKMLKNSSILNGDAENMDRALARELNYAVAAAFHDHLSCTKSAHEYCAIDTIPKEVLNNNLPCKTDHIYANCKETKNKLNVAKSPSNPKELETCELQTSCEPKHRERRMCYPRKRSSKSSSETSNAIESQSVELNINYSPCVPPTGSQHTSVSSQMPTRYFGRKSKTVPSRALKRRYLGPPKTLSIKRELFPNMPSPTFSSSSEGQESNVINQEIMNRPEMNNTDPVSQKILKKRGRKPKKLLTTRDHLTTDSPYFLPDTQLSSHSYSAPQIDVPLWKIRPVTSFYQMEGTENINDPVFQRRHMKCEIDERRRKRWDMQRLREQKLSQKLKLKYCRESDSDYDQKSSSFFPDSKHIEYIEVTEALPVLAFGHVIPLFQPCEFSLPWPCDPNFVLCSSDSNSSSRGKKGRLSSLNSKGT